MDARLQPTTMLRLEPGDAHVIRNAGGSAREALRSVVLSHHLLGTKRIMVIKHTDCAMEGGVDGRIASALNDAGLPDLDLDWGGFAELEEAVHDDVRYLRGRPELRGAATEGWIYDVDRRVLQRVV
jgi:carbonic anhydrase